MRRKWTDYIARNELLRLLCKWRAYIVRKRAPLHRLWAIVKDLEPPGKACLDNISCCLPPRRKWMRLGIKERHRLGEGRVVEATIYRTALRDFALSEDLDKKPNWVTTFEGVMREFDALRQHQEVRFHEPTLHLVQKANGSARRCLASFDVVAERLLLSKAALYLRDVFDPLLSDDCFAFRRDGNFNYKSAIDDVLRYRARYPRRKLYVAECDIQSFFDVINQDVVLDAYDRFVTRLDESARPPEQLRNILLGYLNAFTSRGNLMAATAPKIVNFRTLVKPLEETGVWKFYKKPERAKIRLGIPQGGALSPLIANLVLDVADQAVREDRDPDLFYARFCDDIIIMHPNKAKCRAALKRYTEAMKKLKLPIHPVVHPVSFGSEYYECKSKGPFAWCALEMLTENAVPWISFLGVHVRYDGIVRVRKDTMQRHEKKLRMEAKRFKNAVGKEGMNLKDSSDESKEMLLREFEARIVAMGTGYSTMRHPEIGRRCWTAAFPTLTPDGPAAGQMRHLDSVRGHQVAALKKHLGLKPGKLPSGRKGYYGRPYSYYGALVDVERHKSYPVDPIAYSKW